MALVKQNRTSHSPSPIYGDGSLSMSDRSIGQGTLRPGFTIGDLDASYAYGPNSAPVSVYAARTSTDSSGTQKAPAARAIKIHINVTAGTGSVEVSLKTATDTYATVIFDSGALSLGSHFFYVGGWSTPTDGDNGYVATQYGPVKAGSSPASNDPTGDQETGANKDINADSNYVGGTYNPVNFLSLDGADVKFFATAVGTVTFDVDFVAIS